MNWNTQKNAEHSLLGYVLSLILVLGMLLIWQVNQDPGICRATKVMLDLPMDVIVYGLQADRSVEAAFIRVAEVEKMCSPQVPISKITLLNRSPEMMFRADEDSAELLGRARLLAGLTDGLYDPTILPLQVAWGFGTEQAAVPDEETLKQALESVNWQDLVTEPGMVMLRKPRMGLYLGGLDVGYAAEQAVKTLRERGVKHAILRMGRTVSVLGPGPDGRPWKISLPGFAPGETCGVVEMADAMLTTAGIQRHWFEQDGTRYHDILDPRNGNPVENDLLHVTVTGPSAMDTNALATAAFVAGLAEGQKLIEAQDGFEGIFVTRSKQVLLTPGLAGKVKITDSQFSVNPAEK